MAQALCEQVQYDRDGNLVTGNFADHAIVTAAELPPSEITWDSDARPRFGEMARRTC